jgi:hypothetical protein
VERSEVPGTPDGIAIVGPDRDGQAYTQHYYDFTGELSADGGTISGRWETSADGSTWEHDFDLTYRKVR